MSTKAARGTKRTCQNPQCGSRFYDLNRDPIVCPICETVYQIATGPAVALDDKRGKKKPEFVDEVVAPAEVPEAEGAEELVDIEATEEPIAAEADETFLEEEEEDGGDVSGILGGPVAEGDEEP